VEDDLEGNFENKSFCLLLPLCSMAAAFPRGLSGLWQGWLIHTSNLHRILRPGFQVCPQQRNNTAGFKKGRAPSAEPARARTAQPI
jgi:hypothetical protein